VFPRPQKRLLTNIRGGFLVAKHAESQSLIELAVLSDVRAEQIPPIPVCFASILSLHVENLRSRAEPLPLQDKMLGAGNFSIGPQ
jgi:hypothetical protein